MSACHLLNDLVQSLISAVYPILKTSFHLDFAQLGLITLTYQLTASILQPFVGLYTDRKPLPYSLVAGMGITLAGLLLLSAAPTYLLLLAAAALVGMGSSVFHPESARVARLSSGGQFGMAQSIYQVGGTAGSAMGPLLAAFIVVPGGQGSLAWFSIAALLAMYLLWQVGKWYREHLASKQTRNVAADRGISKGRVMLGLVVLGLLVFSKYFYLAGISSYYTFFLIDKFHLSVRDAQLLLFLFLGSSAAGTLLGGPIGDKIGRKRVLWISILGVLPFTLALPHANLFWTRVLSVVIGLVIASAFSAIVVFAQELVPGQVGMISGVFFGLAFGMGGIGAALLGKLADHSGIGYVYQICSFLPAIGLLTALLPDLDQKNFRGKIS